ncbi:hypothetical protein BDV93DRAFT_505993 [Ceratobasidium sp. AG-I]|nr:hypothetical protein BDV93DRAFT_505993 [Ceratobasidium sp. AG-I]
MVREYFILQGKTASSYTVAGIVLVLIAFRLGSVPVAKLRWTGSIIAERELRRREHSCKWARGHLRQQTSRRFPQVTTSYEIWVKVCAAFTRKRASLRGGKATRVKFRRRSFNISCPTYYGIKMRDFRSLQQDEHVGQLGVVQSS